MSAFYGYDNLMKPIVLKSWEDFEQKSQRIFDRLDQHMTNRPKIIASSSYHGLTVGVLSIGFLGTFFSTRSLIQTSWNYMELLQNLQQGLDQASQTPSLIVGLLVATPLFIKHLCNIAENKGLVLPKGLWGLDFAKSEENLIYKYSLVDPTGPSLEYGALHPKFKPYLIQVLAQPEGVGASTMKLMMESIGQYQNLIMALRRLPVKNQEIEALLKDDRHIVINSYGLSTKDAINLVSDEAKAWKEKAELEISTVQCDAVPVRSIQRL